MPPKKAKLSKEQLKRLVDDYDINFEGPVPPRQWPTQYSHLFQVIRNIWANRYDKYITRTDIDQKTIRKQIARVRDLRTRATSLRMDFSINEDTWRSLIETPVMGRFDQEIVCVRCRNENWQSEYEAQPRNEDDKVKLETKRKRRRQCTCDDGDISGRNLNEDSDEENQTKIFSAVSSGVVSHDPQDGLENSRIPMKPDRVIGLSMNDRYRRYIGSFSVELSHSPVKNLQLMYPFLVLEAKRENGAPGFRSVEAQTAFPIRRFLRIQDELQRASEDKIELDPLVWFFAFQGEEWRLYSAVLDKNKTVQVFQLWHGNLESQDGALQIFQIVDFIWTWARDVYRPQIRMCLSGRVTYPREISPTSTNPFPRSQSVFSVLSVRSVSRPLLDTMLEDETTAPEVVNDDQPDFQDASSHPFLRWSGPRDVSTPWAPHTSFRHSDIVIFSFRVLEIPESQESFHDLISTLRYDDEKSIMMLHALKAVQQNQYTLPLNRGQIHDIEKSWTGVNTQTPYERSTRSHPDQRVEAFFLFRTFCQQEDWQLKREIYCVIWSSQAASVLNMFLETDIDLFFDEESLPSIQHSEFIKPFQQLRQLSGRESVAYALKNTSLILLPCDDDSGRGKQLQWRQPQRQGIPEHVIAKTVALFDSASCSEDGMQSYHHQCGRLLWVLRTEQGIDTPAELETIPDNVGKGGAMLAMKPSAWPQQCPRFCLFVLLGHGVYDEAHLGSLLRYTVQEREMYCVIGDAAQETEPFSAADRHLLRSWEDSFSRQTMPRGQLG